jgi:hypothetical protein
MPNAAQLAQGLVAGLKGDWSSVARPSQLPPEGDWWTVCMRGSWIWEKQGWS